MATPKRTGRQRVQLPFCYYEGYLERSFKDKASRRMWACLCGRTLFFFNNTKDNDYVEKLELNGFISLSDDCSHDRNLDAGRLNLHIKDEEIKLTAPSLEARELWKGFIYSVVKLSVPSSLNLLPGQVHMLREAVEKERERRKSLSPVSVSGSVSNPPIYLPLLGDMPACYQKVSRTEAEFILERNPDCGNLLLRPGRDSTSMAITTRQDLNGSVFRHYRVTRKHDGGFIIDLDNPIPCATLHDVIDCLIEKTSGALEPFLMQETYEENITFIQANEESGERSIQCASSGPVFLLPKLPPKPGQRERMPSREPKSNEDENIYLNESQMDETDVGLEVPQLPTLRRHPALLNQLPYQNYIPTDLKLNPVAERKPLMPPAHPVPAPRSVKKIQTPETGMRLSSPLTTDSLAQGLAEELRLKLEKRRRQQQ